VKMFAAGVAEGAGGMRDQNSYRSFGTQNSIYGHLVTSLGKQVADAQSARPGYGEHQTGLAIDIADAAVRCAVTECFGQLPQGIWLAKYSWRFGFILRYSAVKSMVAGYIYEPWHFPYVGVALSTEIHNTGVTTLEEFFGLQASTDYAN
jgi:D-alanyl-D-alanine carboxypeptidase